MPVHASSITDRITLEQGMSSPVPVTQVWTVPSQGRAGLDHHGPIVIRAGRATGRPDLQCTIASIVFRQQQRRSGCPPSRAFREGGTTTVGAKYFALRRKSSHVFVTSERCLRSQQPCPPKVERGLVASPELWRWSSYRAYALRETGLVRINAWEELNLKATAPERRVKPIRYHRP